MNFGQSLGFLSFLISLYILWEIRQLLLLIFLAIIIAVALNRLVIKLNQFYLTRSTAIVIIIILITIIFNLLFLVILPPFIEQFQLLLNVFQNFPERINYLINNFDYDRYKYFKFIQELDISIEDYNFIPDNLLNNFITFFSNVLVILFQGIFILILSIMFLLNPQKYRHYFRQLFPAFYRYRIDNILDKSEIAIVSWFNGTVINSLFIGLLSGVGLFALQVKFVLVHALLAGLLNFIPNIGPTLSIVFPIMIAIVDYPWKILPIFVLYFIIQNIESYWLTPRVMEEKVSLLPAVTLFAQIFFASTFGLLGLLLALPLTVVFKTIVEEVLFNDILDRWTTEN